MALTKQVQAALNPDPKVWRKVYEEDFNTVAANGEVAAKYGRMITGYPDGTPDTNQKKKLAGKDQPVGGYYMPTRTMSVHDGYLDVHVRTENGITMVAAPTVCDYRFGTQAYGSTHERIQGRVKMDAIEDIKVAFMLWPDEPKFGWKDGEVDFWECLTGKTIWLNNHKPGNPKVNAPSMAMNISSAYWTIFDLLRTPERIELNFYRQYGNRVRRLAGTTLLTDLPQVPMHAVLQIETELDIRTLNPTAQGHIRFDWLRRYVAA